MQVHVDGGRRPENGYIGGVVDAENRRDHMCAIRQTGGVVCWGFNREGPIVHRSSGRWKTHLWSPD
jgi:hypothetical protein